MIPLPLCSTTSSCSVLQSWKPEGPRSHAFIIKPAATRTQRCGAAHHQHRGEGEDFPDGATLRLLISAVISAVQHQHQHADRCAQNRHGHETWGWDGSDQGYDCTTWWEGTHFAQGARPGACQQKHAQQGGAQESKSWPGVGWPWLAGWGWGCLPHRQPPKDTPAIVKIAIKARKSKKAEAQPWGVLGFIRATKEPRMTNRG